MFVCCVAGRQPTIRDKNKTLKGQGITVLFCLQLQDVLCFSGEEGGGGPTVAEARGAAIAAYLCDMIKRVSSRVRGACTSASVDAEEGLCCSITPRGLQETAARRVVTMATVVDAAALHPLLSQPLLFGCSPINLHCDTCMPHRTVSALSPLLVTRPSAHGHLRTGYRCGERRQA